MFRYFSLTVLHTKMHILESLHPKILAFINVADDTWEEIVFLFHTCFIF